MAGDVTIETLISESDIARRVDALADEIVGQCPGRLLVVVILKGSFVFAADLIRALERVGAAPEVDFITLSSYGTGTTSSGQIRLDRDLTGDVAGRNVLIVDDVLESGRTLEFARRLMVERGATRVSTCLLLDKDVPRQEPIEADFVGFHIGTEFVVGYGLDLAHLYRGLPYIGVVKRD